jgi:hypothetical protein
MSSSSQEYPFFRFDKQRERERERERLTEEDEEALLFYFKSA